MANVYEKEIKYNDLELRFALYSLNEIIHGTEYGEKGLESFVKGSLGGTVEGIENLIMELQSVEKELVFLFTKTIKILENAGVMFMGADTQGAISISSAGSSRRF